MTVQAHQQGDYAPVAGIFFMLAASAVFVGSDSVAKHLSATFVVAQILWARYTFHLLYLAALTKPRDYRRLIATGDGRLQFVRSASILTSSLCFYVALKYIPLATAAAISFIWPLVVTALSVPLLGIGSAFGGGWRFSWVSAAPWSSSGRGSGFSTGPC